MNAINSIFIVKQLLVIIILMRLMISFYKVDLLTIFDIRIIFHSNNFFKLIVFLFQNHLLMMQLFLCKIWAIWLHELMLVNLVHIITSCYWTWMLLFCILIILVKFILISLFLNICFFNVLSELLILISYYHFIYLLYFLYILLNRFFYFYEVLMNFFW